jgi:hypothetical protein
METCRSSRASIGLTTSAFGWLGRLVSIAVLVFVGACAGAADETGAGTCPDGATLREAVPSDARAVDSREAAVQRELERLGVRPPDEAVAPAIVQSSPHEGGGESITIGTADGPVTMTLEPQFPGWRIGSSTWCERSG